MELRQTVKRDIIDRLDTTHFTSEDFIVTFGSVEDFDSFIKITFKHNENYTFEVSAYEHSYFVAMKPGEIYDESTLELNSLDGILEEIPKWSNEVRNELKAGGSVYEQIDSLRDIITEQLNIQNEDEEFSVEEINTLKSKFQELENRVRQLEKDKIITESQLSDFTSGIEQVSEDIEFYPKKTWLKTAPNKIVKLVVAIGKSKEGRKLLSDGAKKLFGLE